MILISAQFITLELTISMIRYPLRECYDHSVCIWEHENTKCWHVSSHFPSGLCGIIAWHLFTVIYFRCCRWKVLLETSRANAQFIHAVFTLWNRCVNVDGYLNRIGTCKVPFWLEMGPVHPSSRPISPKGPFPPEELSYNLAWSTEAWVAFQLVRCRGVLSSLLPEWAKFELL